MNPARIIALWYEQGTAADAAIAAHHASGRRKHFTADQVRAIWAKAQRDGRLPPPDVIRPNDGNFAQAQREVIAFWKHLTKGRDAA